MKALINWIKSFFRKEKQRVQGNPTGYVDKYRQHLEDNASASKDFFGYIKGKYGEQHTPSGEQPLVQSESSIIILPRWYPETGYDQPKHGINASELF